jgi:hypothetical protein
VSLGIIVSVAACGRAPAFALDDDAHLVRNDRDRLDIEEIVMESLEVIGRHALAVDGVAPDWFLRHWARSLLTGGAFFVIARACSSQSGLLVPAPRKRLHGGIARRLKAVHRKPATPKCSIDRPRPRPRQQDDASHNLPVYHNLVIVWIACRL